jgi:diguanylate cyclase (GGDEF)-like protein
MVVGIARWIGAIFAAVLLLAGSPALANTVFAPGSTCLAADPDGLGHAALARDTARWSCDPSTWSTPPERAVLRLDLAGRDMAALDTLAMRLTRFDLMALTLEGADGSRKTARYRSDELDLATYDWLMNARLPAFRGEPEALWVEIDAPRDTDMLTDARLVSGAHVGDSYVSFELLVAALCGVMIIPFVYNIAFYRVLRKRFLLWHAAVVACLFTHIMASSGLANRFADLTVMQASALSVTSWTLGIVAAGNFMVNLVEDGKLDRWHRRLTHILSATILAGLAFFLFADGSLRSWTTPVFVYSFIPVLGSFTLMIATALLRGSRAMRFQIIAWAPIMLVGIERAMSNLGAFGSPMDTMVAQHIAIAFEVVVTSLGVADRFMVIKRQRDRAVAETRQLEREVERDELTGLHNRRAIRLHFETLFASGFDTMAVIDLDHFKQINDTCGHAVGDEVLRITALALMPDDDTIAVRMGGEEFMLILRGPNAVARAEHRRRAITARIAAQMPGLGAPVTASMGLVSQPRNSGAHSDFGALYAHCDRLLYEAKRAGRNRTMSERIMRFGLQARPAEAQPDPAIAI